MNVKNAESLGGKKFEALVGVAQEVKNKLDDLEESNDPRDFSYGNFEVDGDDFEIRAIIGVRTVEGFRTRQDFLNRGGVEVVQLMTQGGGASRIRVAVHPNRWKSAGVCYPCVESGVSP